MFEVGNTQVGLAHLYPVILWLTYCSETKDSYSTTSLKTPKFVHANAIARPAFTNDFCPSSEQSREASVDIVESHRHTFSVPSSDDDIDTEDEEDDVQIASSVHGNDEEASAATTPDQALGKAYNNNEDHPQGSKARAAPSETRSLNLKGPSLQDLLTKTAKDGTSQENPINLEGVSNNIIDVDTESEDDGVLPFYESSKKDPPNRSRLWDEASTVRQTSTVHMPMMAAVAGKENNRDSEIQKDGVVPETQARVPNQDEVRGRESSGFDDETTPGATDDFETEDDDGFDYEHEFITREDMGYFPPPSAINVEIPTSSRPKVTFQVGNENPQFTTLTPLCDEYRPSRLGHLSVSDAIDVSQSAEPSSAWHQRTPSPSDAALARKATDPKTNLSRDIFDNFPEPIWPAAAKTTHSYFAEHALDNAALPQDNIREHSWPELQSPEPRSYDQGPFSSQPKVVVPAPHSLKPGNLKNQIKKATVTWADSHKQKDDFVMNVHGLTGTGKQDSKITIPSLVENYLAESPRSLKRKFEGINGSNEVEAELKATRPSSLMTSTSASGRTLVEVNPKISSHSLEEDSLRTRLGSDAAVWHLGEDNSMQPQAGLGDEDSPLPDAQPRETIFQPSTASTSQDEPVLGSVPVITTAQGHDAREPARKKARTSSSSSGGIGKFVMGVGFGLLGAAAAFVATIPTSVYEEALREFSNAA